ncbi:MAG: hypothetical protein RIQ81_2239 [Pseudomonadota bacterium]|jgi:hypothetical protein
MGLMLRVTGILMGIASALHFVQLPIYVIDTKWFVALAAGCLYLTAAIGTLLEKTWGLWLCLTPMLAGVFVVSVVFFGPPSWAPGFRFNIFTALAAAVETPATIMAIVLITRRNR